MNGWHQRSSLVTIMTFLPMFSALVCLICRLFFTFVAATGIVLTELILQEPPRKRLIEKGLAFGVAEFQEKVPFDCPGILSCLVLQCTTLDSSKRPTFKDIVPILKNLYDSLTGDC